MTSFEMFGSGGEEIRVCPKLRAGGMAYAFSSSGRYVRLVSDIPSEGTSGSWYDSSTRVSFDDINNLLDTKGTLQTRDFVFSVSPKHGQQCADADSRACQRRCFEKRPARSVLCRLQKALA